MEPNRDNQSLSPPSSFEILKKTRAIDGWVFASREHLTETKFQGTTAKFEEVPVQTEESIKAKYLALAEKAHPGLTFEVELVLDTHTSKLESVRKVVDEAEFAQIVASLEPKDRVYFVFVREKK